MQQRILFVLAIAACHPKEPVSPWLTAAGSKPCEAMATHLVELLEPGGADPATVDGLRRSIAERCTKDQWTIDAQQCFGEAKSIEATDRCAPMLTVDQRNAFDKAMSDAFKT